MDTWTLWHIQKEKSTYFVVDAETYETNRVNEKTLAIWSFVRDMVFKVLAEFGVCCERVTLKGVKEEHLVTGTGYLQSKGWVMKMSFEEKIGGTTAIKALQTYTRRLDKKYGKKNISTILRRGHANSVQKMVYKKMKTSMQVFGSKLLVSHTDITTHREKKERK